MLSTLVVLVPLASLASATVPGDGGTLTRIESGASAKFGYYAPLRLELVETPPESLTKPPAALEAPLYGVIQPAGANGRVYHVILDEPDGKPARLFIDANGNGDCTDDAPATWEGKPSPGHDGKEYTMHSGGGMLEFPASTTGDEGKAFNGHIAAYRFDKNDPAREQLKGVLLYYRDYGAEGEVTLQGKSYKAMLDDGQATGDFSGRSQPPTDKAGDGPIRLLMDVNGNGKFDSRGESFDTSDPFNIGGTTWEVAVARDGLTLTATQSDKVVAEIPTPPDHSTGKPILAFEATDMDGNAVRFPSQYAGKVVLLDFWATWCGPCIKEMPHVVAAYEKFHDMGFEVLGVTLDSEDAAEKIRKTAGEKGMKWPQIYDGGGWKAAIADKYAINSIPATFLVDGDTGLIIAVGRALSGEGLAKEVEAALAKKKG
ncbi:MAG: TlpA disulfide reductase family protein [Phycisphaerae bacterium]|nr:TlpA disulfide reductase family protein [Phycisphaerae bacterium]